MGICSTKFVFLLFLLSAIPIAYLISLELATPPTHVYQYHSSGWFRECAKWDHLNSRFLVSFLEGGVAQLSLPKGSEGDDSTVTVLEELTLIKDVDLAGNGSLGIVVDHQRNRLLVVSTDVIGKNYAALAAYDLSTWQRLFLTHLSGP
ncbi:hypothetical protein CMV_022259, partial [Castanea mollissima]